VSTPRPALLIDTAEWFLDEAWRAHVTPRHWRRLPPRGEVALRAAFDALRVNGVRATFLISAITAERAGELLVELIEAGHEIALSIRSPVPLDEVGLEDRDAYRRAWHGERAAVESVIGRGVHGFGAAWVVGEAASDPWWHAVLRELGFQYDATPRRGGSSVRVLGGSSLEVMRFAAWRLDGEQPRLMGLPAAARAAHEAGLEGALPELSSLAASAGASVAAQLNLGARPAGPLPAPPSKPAAQGLAAAGLPRLAVVVPLKDEAVGLSSLFTELELLSRALADVATCEFVMVDDGSVDETWTLLERLARNRQRFRLVRHDTNRGVAAAIRTGLLATDAAIVASIDGDLSYDPMELRRMVPMIDDADVVTASPYHREGSVRNVPAWRLLLSRTLSRAYRLLLGSRVSTWTSCFRVYRRAAVTHLPLDHPGFLGTAELLVRVLRRGGRVIEHPCTLEARLLGFSKMSVLRVALGHLRLLCLVAVRVVK